MLGTVATCTIVTIEIGLVTYNLYKSGVLNDLANKFKRTVKRDYQAQPSLKELVWKSSLA